MLAATILPTLTHIHKAIIQLNLFNMKLYEQLQNTYTYLPAMLAVFHVNSTYTLCVYTSGTCSLTLLLLLLLLLSLPPPPPADVVSDIDCPAHSLDSTVLLGGRGSSHRAGSLCALHRGYCGDSGRCTPPSSGPVLCILKNKNGCIVPHIRQAGGQSQLVSHYSLPSTIPPNGPHHPLCCPNSTTLFTSGLCVVMCPNMLIFTTPLQPITTPL